MCEHLDVPTSNSILFIWEKRWRRNPDKQLSEELRESFMSKPEIVQLEHYTHSEVLEAIDKYPRLDDIVREARSVANAAAKAKAKKAEAKAERVAAAKAWAKRPISRAEAKAAADYAEDQAVFGDGKANATARLEAKNRAKAQRYKPSKEPPRQSSTSTSKAERSHGPKGPICGACGIRTNPMTGRCGCS